MTDIRPPNGQGPRPLRPEPAAPCLPTDGLVPRSPAPAAPRDRAALDPAASTPVLGAKKPLAAYTPAAGDAAGGEAFGSKGLRPPAAAGLAVVVNAAEGDFEVQAEWAEGPQGLVPAGVGVRANAQGDFVTVDAQGAVRVGGQPLALTPEAPHALPGGGSVTSWGAGYVAVASAAGDGVSVFAQGDRVAFVGQLAGDRLPGAIP